MTKAGKDRVARRAEPKAKTEQRQLLGLDPQQREAIRGWVLKSTGTVGEGLGMLQMLDGLPVISVTVPVEPKPKE